MPEITVSVHQPNFMPWLKLLDKILASDVYIAYDTVQYTKSEYHGRQKVRCSNGPRWLSVPLLRGQGQSELIRDVRIDNGRPFRKKHLLTLEQNYGRTSHFDEVYPLVEKVYRRTHEHLVDLNLDLIEEFCRYLRSPVRIVRASALEHRGDNTERLIHLLRGVGGDVHLTSTFGTDRRYIDWDRLRDAGIGVRAQMFEHPVYAQPSGEFVANLAAVDMLFCCGRRTAEILAARRRFGDVVEPVRVAPSSSLRARP